MTAVAAPTKLREVRLFRNNRNQVLRIPVEFELPGDRALIRREGSKLIIEPVLRPTNIIELLAQWRQEAPLQPEHQLPAIEDVPAQPENIFDQKSF